MNMGGHNSFHNRRLGRKSEAEKLRISHSLGLRWEQTTGIEPSTAVLKARRARAIS